MSWSPNTQETHLPATAADIARILLAEKFGGSPAGVPEAVANGHARALTHNDRGRIALTNAEARRLLVLAARALVLR